MHMDIEQLHTNPYNHGNIYCGKNRRTEAYLKNRIISVNSAEVQIYVVSSNWNRKALIFRQWCTLANIHKMKKF
jgi:hypothetical protein